MDIDVSTTDSSGRTALTWAAQNGHLETCRLLVDNGVNINALDSEGVSALLAASRSGYSEICRLLISSGANVLVGKNAKETPISYAVHGGLVLPDRGGSICPLMIKAAFFKVTDKDRRNALGKIIALLASFRRLHTGFSANIRIKILSFFITRDISLFLAHRIYNNFSIPWQFNFLFDRDNSCCVIPFYTECTIEQLKPVVKEARKQTTNPLLISSLDPETLVNFKDEIEMNIEARINRNTRRGRE